MTFTGSLWIAAPISRALQDPIMLYPCADGESQPVDIGQNATRLPRYSPNTLDVVVARHLRHSQNFFIQQFWSMRLSCKNLTGEVSRVLRDLHAFDNCLVREGVCLPSGSLLPSHMDRAPSISARHFYAVLLHTTGCQVATLRAIRPLFSSSAGVAHLDSLVLGLEQLCNAVVHQCRSGFSDVAAPLQHKRPASTVETFKGKKPRQSVLEGQSSTPTQSQYDGIKPKTKSIHWMRHEIELLSKLVTESTLPDWDSISAIVGRSTQVCIAKWEGTLHPKLLRMELSRAASEYRRDHTSLSIAFGPCVTVRKKASGPTEDVAATRSPIREGSPSSIGVGCPSQSSKPIATRKEDRRSTSSSFIWRGTFSDVCIPRRTCWTHKEKSELRNLLALPDPPPWKDIAFVVGHTVEACKERSTRKRRTWTPKQDQQLMSSRSCQPRPSWEETASQIGYSANACKQRFAQYLRSQPARLFWTTEQECLLQNACAKELNLTWNQIAHAVGHGRTARACETRYCEMRARLTWKPEEDQKLRDLRACVPPTCWKEISKEFGRSSSECERRIAHLRLTSGQGRKTSQRQPLRVYPLYLPRSTDVENNCLQGDNIALADSIAASTDVEALEGPSEPPAVKATCTDIADKRPHYTGTRQAWTREEEQRLVKCRVEGQISWSETARIVGRSETSCQTKLYQLLEQIRRSKSNLADQTSPSNSAEEPAVSDVSHLDKEPSFRTRWTPEESERLRKSRASRPLPKWERTAQIVGRPSKACRMHYANLQKAGLSEPTTVPSEDQDVETGSGGQVSDVSVADAARLSLRWSEEEKEALLKSRACRPLPSWQQTAGAVGRPSASCQQMYFKLKRHLLADPAVAPVGDSLPLEDATHPAHGDTVMRNQDADGYSAQAQAGLGEPLEEPSLVVVQELKSGLDISNMAESAPVAAPPAAGSMTHWTQEEHRILNECLARRPHLSWDKIAEIVGRSETSCRAKTKTLKRISLEQAPEGEDRPAYARRPHLKRPWKPREEKRLLEGRANTPQLTWADIGKSLSRTANACQIRWTQIHDRRGL